MTFVIGNSCTEHIKLSCTI